MAADSTMLRMVNLLIALSLGVHREQLLHRIGLVWPRPFLFRPLLRRKCQQAVLIVTSTIAPSSEIVRSIESRAAQNGAVAGVRAREFVLVLSLLDHDCGFLRGRG
jgi:hypothetical protein